MSDGKEPIGQANNALLDLQGGGATLEEGAVGVGIASVGGSKSSMKDCIGINRGNISIYNVRIYIISKYNVYIQSNSTFVVQLS